MNRLVSSRKMWGALLGSIAIIIITKVSPESAIANSTMLVGGLWMAAIGGQAYSDIIKEKKQ